MASAIRDVKKMLISPMRDMYSWNTGLKFGRREGLGQRQGERRLWYNGSVGEGMGWVVERSICSRWSIVWAVISASRRE